MFKNVRLKQNSFKPYLQIDVKLINSRSEKITFYSFACFFFFYQISAVFREKMKWLKVFQEEVKIREEVKSLKKEYWNQFSGNEKKFEDIFFS